MRDEGVQSAECRMQSDTFKGIGIKERGTFITRSEIDKIYTRGYEKGVKDMEERLKKYYTSFTGKTMSVAVAYAIKITAEELLKGG